MYRCKGVNPPCSYSSNSPKGYVSHWRTLHCSGPNSTFICGYRICPRRFSAYSSFVSHIYRDHKSRSKPGTVLSENVTPSIEYGIACESCNSTFNSISNLTQHLKSHVDGAAQVTCPYRNCTKSYTIYKSLVSHICKYHKRKSDITYAQQSTSISTDICGSDVASSTFTDVNFSSVDLVNIESNGNFDTRGTDFKNGYIRNLALFYLTLYSKHHVTQSVTQVIHNQITSMINSVVEMVALEVTQKLSSHVDHDLLANIVREAIFESNTTFDSKSNDPLRSAFCRRQFFEDKFSVVQPVELTLGLNNTNKEMRMHYIPILKSLTTFLSNDSVYEQWYCNSQSIEVNDPHSITDIHDGLHMKNHLLFSTDKTALQVILFQDEFLIANPLGSSKKNLKMLGVYYTLGNVHPWHRSKVDPMQLVLLCKSKDLKFLGELGQQKVFGPLIKDIKILEQRGICVKGQTVRGTLAFISGDNLGSHFIGGFLENFSKSVYFCRFCNIERNAFHDGQSFGQPRTRESYDKCVAELTDDLVQHVEGIKFDSLFNTLQFFHVNDGLPPCVGHDVFEGIAQYDLPLAFGYFSEQGWFKQEDLNRRIERFNYKGLSCNDKPCPVSLTGKLGGHAIQTWTLIRFLPLLIADKIANKDDAVWKMILHLIVIVQIVCSPKTNMQLIALLSETIEDYLCIRKNMFPHHKLRPKHHYMSHYPRLIRQHGPLIRVWTMRFESKHKYFKDCQRSSKNVINVTKTLAEKHQLLQAAYCANAMFQQEMCFETGTEYFCGVFSDPINKAISDANLNTLKLRLGEKATFRSITYSKDNLVILDSYVNLNMLRIVCVVTDESEIYLIGKKIKGILIENIQLFAIEESDEESLTCCSVKSLQDYHPYHIYVQSALPFPVISLKYLTN